MAKIIGIDLGTSNTAAAVMEGGKVTIIPSAEGTTLGGKAIDVTPQAMAWTEDEQDTQLSACQLLFSVWHATPDASISA